jgi:hypothetical protein
VSPFLACIGSPCLRHRVHGASIGGGGTEAAPEPAQQHQLLLHARNHLGETALHLAYDAATVQLLAEAVCLQPLC